MFYTVSFFGALCAVPLIHGTHKIAGDPADPFKWYMLKLIVKIGKLAIRFYIQGFEPSMIFVLQIFNICLLFWDGNISGNLYAHFYPPVI